MKAFILIGLFCIAFYLGFRHGCKFMLGKFWNYQKSKGKTNEETGEILVDLLKQSPIISKKL